jgi:hypothetical protein
MDTGGWLPRGKAAVVLILFPPSFNADIENGVAIILLSIPLHTVGLN